ncbi:transposase [Haloglomus irregulare]|jgi:IS605 OrfB family transposase|uniref:Transposase n=1 Tax=Haloglomus irregulare TaxID=2234134 RepID=A0A554N806_9EURY|nr:RNA-guided endonuclease TnpB family protein [Haloglomus irregulare]TSD13537.1 transposase [Haloglomus irregulare]
MPVVTKTLELHLVTPNTHKERKLRETKIAYQQALQTAFDANCTTRTEANDVVVKYALSGYVKNALKQYVPQLCGGSYDADELHDDHPVKFTNEGIRLDHQPQNHYEWYVKIPHHEDYNLWMPAAANPEQRPWLEALHAGDAEMGECRLLERDGKWYLHVTATRDVEARSVSTDRTPVGVDIGDAALATVCHRDERGTPTAPDIYSDDASQVRHLRKTYFTATRRLQRRDSERIAETYGDSLWDRIDHILHRVSRNVVERVQQVDSPVLVLENLQYIRENMEYGAFMNRRLHGWAFAKLHAQIQYKAEEAGIPVETVNPRNTSKECHVCGEKGARPEQARFRCTNDECWVGEYQADVNAAINIADRYRSGESQRRSNRDTGKKATGDDSATDGASLTGPQDTQADAESRQTTLGTHAS